LEIGKLRKEMKVVMNDSEAYSSRNNQMVASLNGEIDRLRKFLNARQQEGYT
jgi:hypothetical protein